MLFSKHLGRYYRKYWYYFVLVILCDVLVDVLQLFLPRITGGIVTCLSDPSSVDRWMTTGIREVRVSQVLNGVQVYSTEAVPFYYSSFRASLVSVAVLTVFIVLGRMGWRYFSARIGAHLEKDLRSDLYAHIQTLSLSYFSDRKIGGLLSYFTSDIQALKQLFIEGFIFLTDILVLGSLSFAYMELLSWKLGLLVAVPLLLFVFLGRTIGKMEAKKSKEAGDAFEALSDYTEESLAGIQVVQAFSQEGTRQNGFQSKAKDAYRTNVGLAHFSSLLDAGVNLLLTAVYALLLAVGAYSLLIGRTFWLGNIKTAGDFVTFSGYCDSLIWPMMAGGLLISEVANAKGSYDRIATILEEKEEIVDSPEAKDHPVLTGEVEARHLTFSYPGSSKPALSDVSFHVAPGTFVGVLGRTGSGKSTLVALLSKLYPIEKGELFVDRDDLTEWKKGQLREQVGYVGQTSFLFSGTILDSIGFSEPSGRPVDERKAREASYLAGVDEDILAFPDGYRTKVGEKGSTLSGGQRQRIAIARALYKDPSLLILDDSLSAVDADTEKKILDRLKHRERKVTTFLISHRVSTLEQADWILVLDQGRLVGQGVDATLRENCPLYRNIAELQQLEKEVL